MQTLPITLKKTPRTRLIQLHDGKAVKVIKSRSASTLSMMNPGQRWGELAKEVKEWKWHCEELGLVNLTRLEMERELLNINGWDLEKWQHNESLSNWML